MRKMLAVVTGLLTAMMFMVVLNPPPAGAVTCTTHYSTDYRYVTKDVALAADPKWRIMFELRYRHCQQRARHWVDPLSSKMGCRKANDVGVPLRHTVWRVRFWDPDHHGFSSGPWKLECNSSDWTTKFKLYETETRLHKCAAGPPQWRAKVKFDIAGDTDKHSKVASAFWGFSGPTLVTC